MQQKIDTTNLTKRLKRAARRAERLMRDYAQNGATTWDKMVRAIDRVDAVYVEEMGAYDTLAEREAVLEELAKIRRGLPGAEIARRDARTAAREAEMERLRVEERAGKREVRYVPGVGYVSR